MGSGYYVAASHPPDMDRRTVDELAREMIADVTTGVGDTGIRAGLLGEIGCTYPWTENEKKVLRAAIAAQRETGAPLMIHPGRHPRACPWSSRSSCEKEGGDLRRTIMCHICRTIADVRAVIDLAQTGMWLEYDLFGLENSYYPYNPSFDMPNDGGRMAHVLALIEAGHHDQILLSHDIAYKTSLVKYGGLRLSPPAGQRGAAPPRQGRGRRGPPPAARREPGARLRLRVSGAAAGQDTRARRQGFGRGTGRRFGSGWISGVLAVTSARSATAVCCACSSRAGSRRRRRARSIRWASSDS